MTKISIIISSSDPDNKELFPVSSSSYFKLWISSDIDTEEEENIGTDDTDSIDSDTLEAWIYQYVNYDRIEKYTSTLILQ